MGKMVVLSVCIFFLSRVMAIGEGISVEDMRLYFRSPEMGQSLTLRECDNLNKDEVIYPAPLRSKNSLNGLHCFWSVKDVADSRYDGSGYVNGMERLRQEVTVRSKRYLRLDSIEGLSYDDWPDKIKRKYRCYDPEVREELARDVSGRFYVCAPRCYMGWWVADYSYQIEVDDGRVSLLLPLDSRLYAIANDMGWKEFWRQNTLFWFEDYCRRLSTAMEGRTRYTVMNWNGPEERKVYDLLVIRDGQGKYDMEILRCSSEPGKEYDELRRIVQGIGPNYRLPELWTVKGEKLPGFYMEFVYECSKDSCRWAFSVEKYFFNKD